MQSAPTTPGRSQVQLLLRLPNYSHENWRTTSTGKTLVLMASEAALLAFGLVVATALRFNNIDSFRQEIAQPGALLRYAIVVVVCGLALYYYDLYDLQIVTRRSVLFVRLLQALGSACLILAFLYYWYPDLSLARGVAAISAPLIIVTVAGWRLVVDASAPFLRRKERILIVGDGPAGSRLAEEVLRRPELNIEIIGFLNGNSDGSAVRTSEQTRFIKPACRKCRRTTACDTARQPRIRPAMRWLSQVRHREYWAVPPRQLPRNQFSWLPPWLQG